MSTTPYHEHNCNCSHYLGSKEYPELKSRDTDKIDFYVCEELNGRPTVIARFGNDSDYFSSFSTIRIKANNLVNSNKAQDLVDAVDKIVNQSEPSLNSILGEAVKRAIEHGYLNEQLEYSFKKQEKRVFRPV